MKQKSSDSAFDKIKMAKMEEKEKFEKMNKIT